MGDVVALWPCSTCRNPGVKTLGVESYCSTCLARLYSLFDPAAFVDGGVGVPDGLQRPDYGPLYEDLRCCRCAATWCGVAGASCWWCLRGLEIQREHQAELLLRPPEVARSDSRREAALNAWADRLAIGVKAGLIDEHEARRALNKAIA